LLRRVIIRLLEDALAEALLSGTIREGDMAIVDLNNDSNVVVHPAAHSERLLESIVS
jgi:ATP-dependent Clp protease ATP-binding subunit ClpC